MPEAEEKKTVDIDTSGPEVEIKLPEEKIKEEDKTYEDERETKLEDGGSATDNMEKYQYMLGQVRTYQYLNQEISSLMARS